MRSAPPNAPRAAPPLRREHLVRAGGGARNPGSCLPDAVEVEPEHEIGVEHQPPALVRWDVRRPERLTDHGQGGGHVEVVVDGGDEAVVEPQGRRRERRGDLVRAIRQRDVGDAAIEASAWCPATPFAIPIGRAPADPARNAGGAANGPSAGGGPSAARCARSEPSAAAAASIDGGE